MISNAERLNVLSRNRYRDRCRGSVLHCAGKLRRASVCGSATLSRGVEEASEPKPLPEVFEAHALVATAVEAYLRNTARSHSYRHRTASSANGSCLTAASFSPARLSDAQPDHASSASRQSPHRGPTPQETASTARRNSRETVWPASPTPSADRRPSTEPRPSASSAVAESSGRSNHQTGLDQVVVGICQAESGEHVTRTGFLL